MEVDIEGVLPELVHHHRGLLAPPRPVRRGPGARPQVRGLRRHGLPVNTTQYFARQSLWSEICFLNDAYFSSKIAYCFTIQEVF